LAPRAGLTVAFGLASRCFSRFFGTLACSFPPHLFQIMRLSVPPLKTGYFRDT
jgi:hypothetical protein